MAKAPTLQRFHEKYRNDPDVLFITIDYNGNVDKLRAWMGKRRFDFPVLLDDGYVEQAKVSSFPTTWFLDRQGRIAFTDRGASDAELEGRTDVMLEEFVWRVEMLRAGAPKSAR